MTKIGVLGCGWLGMPLAKYLLKEGYLVFGSTTTTHKIDQLKKEGISPFLIDLEKDLLSKNVDSFFNVDELIITIPPKSKQQSELTYLDKIKKVVSIIERSKINRVTYISSISVYGNQSGEISESNIPNPISESGKQILEVEKLLFNNPTFKTNIIRFGGLIGKRRHPAFYLSGKELTNGNDLVNLIHLNDCIGIISAIIKSDITQEIFNGVTPYHPTKQEYYSSICQQFKLPLPIINTSQEFNQKRISAIKVIKSLNYTFKNCSLNLTQ